MLALLTLFTGKKPNGLPSGLPSIGANLNRARLSGCNLSNESLVGADFFEARLAKTNFTGANLSEASFLDADAQGTIFCSANLERCDFRGTNASGADFNSAKLKNAVFNKKSKLPFPKAEAIRLGMVFCDEETGLY